MSFHPIKNDKPAKEHYRDAQWGLCLSLFLTVVVSLFFIGIMKKPLPQSDFISLILAMVAIVSVMWFLFLGKDAFFLSRVLAHKEEIFEQMRLEAKKQAENMARVKEEKAELILVFCYQKHVDTVLGMLAERFYTLGQEKARLENQVASCLEDDSDEATELRGQLSLKTIMLQEAKDFYWHVWWLIHDLEDSGLEVLGDSFKRYLNPSNWPSNKETCPDDQYQH